jgi:hypothetical protein
MSSVQFEYEIPRDEYVAAQLLYFKLHRSGHGRAWAATWILLGVVFVVMAVNARPPAWASYDSSVGLPLLLLAGVGLYWIFAGRRMLFPAGYFRRAYGSFPFAGKSFTAFVDETGFQIEGEYHKWCVEWPGVSLKGEDKQVFIFVSGGTIFIFGKKFLSDEQQEGLRKLSGLPRA